jgi:hypothetical protein
MASSHMAHPHCPWLSIISKDQNMQCAGMVSARPEGVLQGCATVALALQCRLNILLGYANIVKRCLPGNRPLCADELQNRQESWRNRQIELIDPESTLSWLPKISQNETPFSQCETKA